MPHHFRVTVTLRRPSAELARILAHRLTRRLEAELAVRSSQATVQITEWDDDQLVAVVPDRALEGLAPRRARPADDRAALSCTGTYVDADGRICKCIPDAGCEFAGCRASATTPLERPIVSARCNAARNFDSAGRRVRPPQRCRLADHHSGACEF